MTQQAKGPLKPEDQTSIFRTYMLDEDNRSLNVTHTLTRQTDR